VKKEKEIDFQSKEARGRRVMAIMDARRGAMHRSPTSVV